MHFTNVAECQRAAPTAPPTGARWRIPYKYLTSSTGGLPSSLPLRQLHASSYVSSPACLWPSGSRCERGCEGKRNMSVLRWLVLAIFCIHSQPQTTKGPGPLVDWAGGNWVDFQVPLIATKRWPLASIRNADPSRAIQSAGAVCVTTNKPRFGSTATSKMGIMKLGSL